MIIDGDGHIYEPHDMWRRYAPARDAELTLSIEGRRPRVRLVDVPREPHPTDGGGHDPW